MQNEDTYNLTFTAGTLLLNETYAVAEAFLDCGRDWDKTQEITFEQHRRIGQVQSSRFCFFPENTTISSSLFSE